MRTSSHLNPGSYHNAGGHRVVKSIRGGGGKKPMSTDPIKLTGGPVAGKSSLSN